MGSGWSWKSIFAYFLVFFCVCQFAYRYEGLSHDCRVVPIFLAETGICLVMIALVYIVIRAIKDELSGLSLPLEKRRFLSRELA